MQEAPHEPLQPSGSLSDDRSRDPSPRLAALACSAEAYACCAGSGSFVILEVEFLILELGSQARSARGGDRGNVRD